MADRELPLEDLLGFMDDDERARWDSGTEEQRAAIREDLTSLWCIIPDPTEDDLKTPYMPYDTWQTYQAGGNREGIRGFYVRQWKRERKAQARAELEKRKAEERPPEARDERAASSTRSELDDWWKPIDAINEAAHGKSEPEPPATTEPLPRFDIPRFDPSSLDLSFLHPFEQDRIRRCEYTTQERNLLDKGQNPWTESGKPKPLPPNSESRALHLKVPEEALDPALPTTAAPKSAGLVLGKTSEEWDRLLDSLPDPGDVRSVTRDMLDQWDLRPRQEVAEREEAERKDDQKATARAIEQAIHKALRQNQPLEQPKVEFLAEIKKHPGWYLLAFLLSTLPVAGATIWPTLTHKTVPEWLADRGLPSVTTLAIGWILGMAMIALVIVARSYITAKQKRELLASQRLSVSFKLTKLTSDRYNDNCEIMLARFKYSTGVGLSPKVEVKANLTVFDQTALRLSEYAGAWHGSKVRSKRFSAGDSADLVIGLVDKGGMTAYEYHISKVGGVTFDANLTDLRGEVFYVQAVFMARERIDDVLLFEETQWFRVDAGENPSFVGITQPSHLW